MDVLVFVYGTLKRGEPNHYWLSDTRASGGSATWLGPGVTRDTWPLVVVTEYNIPMMLGTWRHARGTCHLLMTCDRLSRARETHQGGGVQGGLLHAGAPR